MLSTTVLRLILLILWIWKYYTIPALIDAAFILSFQLVVVSNAPDSVLVKLSELLYGANIPLVVLHSIGFLGSIRLQYRNHNIVEARGDAEIFDLRIGEGFAELKEFSASFELDSLDSMEHSHVPFVVILVKALDLWRAQVCIRICLLAYLFTLTLNQYHREYLAIMFPRQLPRRRRTVT
jgi:hypothetical protein